MVVNHNSTLPPPPPNANKYQKKRSGDFGKAFKWGSGVSLGCLGPGCLGIILIFSLLVGLGTSSTGLGSDFTVQENVLESGGKDKIAVIDIEGVITREADASERINGYSSSYDINNLLDKVADDKDIKAVVLSINSPGGYVSPTVDIYDKIKEVKGKGKKVIVSMGDTTASGGYYIAASADAIFAERSTTTGSLGVVMTLMNFSGLFDKYGYKEVVIKSGEFKDMGSWSRDITDEEKKIFQHFIDEAYDDFVKAIAKGRNMDESKVRKIADGRIYTGTQAMELGMVDHMGGFWDAVGGAEYAAGISNATIVELSKQGSFKESIISNLSKFPTFGLDIGKFNIENNTPKLKYQWIP